MVNYSNQLDHVFHALADPTRRAVIQQLARGPASVTTLAKPFPASLPSFMKHIGVLEESGLISSNKVGRVRTCLLKPKKLDAAENWFLEQRAIWAGRHKNLDDLLVTLNGDQNED